MNLLLILAEKKLTPSGSGCSYFLFYFCPISFHNQNMATLDVIGEKKVWIFQEKKLSFEMKLTL